MRPLKVSTIARHASLFPGGNALDVQSHRQEEIDKLANLVVEADNEDDAAAANDQLGEFIFGK